MGWHLQTRSRNHDYCFLGQSPDRWWSAWSNDTSFEKPTLLIESDTEGWRLLASGIPSSRRDRSRTAIRHTLVGSGAHGEDVEAAGALIAAWLDEAASLLAGDEPGALSRALDQHFTDEVIEAWFEGDPRRADLSDEVEQGIDRALKDLDAPVAEGAKDGIENWFGGIQSPDCRGAFLARARRLLRGKVQGGAYLLNLTEHPDQLRSSHDLSGVALLFDLPAGRATSPIPWRPTAVGRVKKKRPALPAAPEPTPVPVRPRRSPSAPPSPAASPGRGDDRRRPDGSRRRGVDGLDGLDPDISGARDLGALFVETGKGLWEKGSEWLDKGRTAIQERSETLRKIETYERGLEWLLDRGLHVAQEAGLEETYDEFLKTLEGLSSTDQISRLERFVAVARAGPGKLDQALRALIRSTATPGSEPALPGHPSEPPNLLASTSPTGVGPSMLEKRSHRAARSLTVHDRAIDLLLCRAPRNRKRLIKERLDRARRR